MSDFTVSRPGQVQAAGDEWALFEDVFSGEVLAAFMTAVNLRDKHMIRQISSGKSATFPMIYKAAAQYHTPGVEIDGQSIQHDEKLISLDHKLIAPVFIADIDEAMSHYEFRAPYSAELGQALALAYDQNVARNIILAARGAATFEAGYDDGATIVDADAGTNATSLLDSITDARRIMDEKDVAVDAQPVYSAVKPLQWYQLARLDDVINKEKNSDGDIKSLNLTTLSDVTIVKSNALPWGTNDSANTGLPSKYRADFTNTVAAVWNPAAVGTVQLMDLDLQSESTVRHQGTLMLGRYMVGHGTLRHQCAVEIAIA